jgi:hypothetical protein
MYLFIMEVKLDKHHLYSIIKRFNFKFKLRRNPDQPNPNKFIYQIEDINLIKAYIGPCTYSNNENIKKKNLIIKYKLNNEEEISLNVLLDEYKDLLSNKFI